MNFSVLAVALVALPVVVLASPRDVAAQLERIREQHQVPGLAAAAVVEGEIVAIGAAGYRDTDAADVVTIDDKWHVGSCTKSMTASVAAMLVEEGRLSWHSTIAHVLPDLAMDEAWQDVTLEDLLQHRGGAPHDPPRQLWKQACAQQGTPTEQRLAFVRGILAEAPEHPAGTRWVYSDSGYAIVGVMMERATGQAWEEMMRERLFLPLGMMSAGFGPPASAGKHDEPWGHLGYEAPYKPVPPGPDADNPPAIAPAAAVHCSIADLARYVAWHVAGDRGDGWLLEPESFRKLHDPPEGGSYAMGWSRLHRRWAGGPALMHNGDNNMFYAVMWLGPNADTAFVAAVNADGYDATDACDDAIRFLINEF